MKRDKNKNTVKSQILQRYLKKVVFERKNISERIIKNFS